MRNKTLICLLLIVVFIGVEFMSSPAASHAQSTPTLIYATDYNTEPPFPDEYGAGSADYPEEWADDCGVDDSGCIYNDFNSYYDGGKPSAVITIDQSAPNTESVVGMTWSACVINYIEFDVWYSTNAVGGEEDSYMLFVMDDDGSSSIESGTQDNDFSFSQRVDFADVPGNVEGEWWRFSAVLSNASVMNAYTIEIRSALDNITSLEPPPVMDIKVDNIEIWCDYEVGLIRPFSIGDEHSLFEMFDRTYAEAADPGNTRYSFGNDSVSAFSDSSGSPVHAAADGTVYKLRPADPEDDCPTMMLIEFDLTVLSGNPPTCYVFIPEEVASTGDPFIPNDGNHVYNVKMEDAWIVGIETDSGYIEYLVANADEYVSLGMEVNGGCVLGESILLVPFSGSEADAVQDEIDSGTGGIAGPPIDFLQFLSSDYGFTGLVMWDGEDRGTANQLELYTQLTEYASNDNPCNATDPTLADCITGDPEMTIQGAWRVHGRYVFNDPGFTILPSSYIQQTLALDDSTTYSMSVSVRVTTRTIVRLQLGESTGNFTVEPGIDSVQNLRIPNAAHDPDLSEYWTARVTNVSGGELDIISICVREGDPVEVEPPSSCYFVNPSFESDDGWDTSAGVVERDGSLGVPDTENIEQEITLPAGDYTLSVKVYVWYDGTSTTRIATTTDTIGLSYEWDGGGAADMTGPDGTTTTPFSWFWSNANAIVNYRGEYTADFNVATETTGIISITAVIDTEATGIYGAGIDLACIRIQGEDDIVDDSCTEVTAPNDENLSSWVTWGWLKLNGFFQCQLMPMLTKIKDTLVQLYQLTGWQIRYWKATAYSSMNWLKYDLFPWFDGQFANMARGSQAVYYINNESGANLWDFLVALVDSALGPFINGLTSIINTLLIQLGGLLGGLLNFASLVISLIAQLIFLLIQSLTNLLTVIISGLINIIMFILFAIFSLLQLIISGLFALVFALLFLIFGLLGDLITLFIAIVTGWQTATPTAIPGLPACNVDPTSNYLCVPLFILENTIFEPDGPGGILLTILIAYGSIELIMWVIDEIRGIVMKASEAA